MKFTVRMFWFAITFSNGLANLSSSTVLDRELTFFNPPSKINSTDEDGFRDVFSYRREGESQKTYFKRDQSHYDRERVKSNYSTLNRNESGAARIFRTYGKGKAQVRQGQTVNVPNEVRRKGNKGPMVENTLEKNENEIKATSHQRSCKLCPTDQTVIATKGNLFALLPEPCQPNPRMWVHYSGPKPGSKILEGVHLIQGYLGPHKKFCQYYYEVSVRRCEPLKAKEDTIIKCSAENSWGSICNVSCGYEKELVGSPELECKEDLTWSNSISKCKDKNDCSTPKVKTNSKVSCQTGNVTQVEGDFIPNGSTCKFQQNRKEVSIKCKDGKWRMYRKSKTPLNKKYNPKNKNKTSKNHACNPNPCQNGGTCLKPESITGSPICKCRPQTRGVYCEMRECYYNACKNDGLCFFQNEERICYCTSDYSGDTCQHYTP